jgi:tRNA(fMet)-specific endonuclease VapC
MILLDTDHFTVLRYTEHPRAAAWRSRLESADDPDVALTAITVEEQLRGWLAAIGRQRNPVDQVPIYEQLTGVIRQFSTWHIVPFDARAATAFEGLRAARIRIGSPDLKIASIVLVQDALLLSANLRDFGKVPGLRIENWLE